MKRMKKLIQASLVMTLLWQMLPPAQGAAKVYAEEITGQSPVEYVNWTDSKGRLVAQPADRAAAEAPETHQMNNVTSLTPKLPANASLTGETEAAEEPAIERKLDADGHEYAVKVDKSATAGTLSSIVRAEKPMLQAAEEEAVAAGDNADDASLPVITEEEAHYTDSYEDGVPVSLLGEALSQAADVQTAAPKHLLGAAAEQNEGVNLLLSGAHTYVDGLSAFAIGENSIYNRISGAAFEVTPTEEGLIVHLSGLSWDSYTEVYIVGSADGGGIFSIPITKANLGQTLTLDVSGFTEVTTEIQGADDSLSVEDFAVTPFDKNGTAITALPLTIGSRLQPGVYNFQLNAEDDARTYSLLKKNVAVGGGKTVVSFSEQEIVIIPVTAESSGLKLSWLSATYWEGFNTIYWARSSGKPFIALSRYLYDDVRLYYYSEEKGYNYEFYQNDVEASRIASMAIDFNLTMTMDMNNTLFAGAVINPNLDIYEGNGKMRLRSIWGAEGEVPVNVTWKKNNVVISESTTDRQNPIITAPSQPGTYTLTLTLDGDVPFNATWTKQITVKSSDLSLLLVDQDDATLIERIELSSKQTSGPVPIGGAYNSIGLSFTTKKTDQGTLVTVGASLADCNSCYVSVKTNNYFFTQSVSSKNKGIPITVDPSKLVKLSWQVPYADDSFTANSKVVAIMDANNVTINYMQSDQDFAVSPGRYNLQLNGIDRDHAYTLFRENVTVNGASQILSFARSEVSELSITMDDQRLHTWQLLPFPNNSNIWISYSAPLEGRTKVYLTKGDYRMDVTFADGDNWQYGFEADYSSGKANQELHYDSNFRFADQLRDRYNAGDGWSYFDDIPVVDSYGNRLNRYMTTDWSKTAVVEAAFTDQSGSKVTDTADFFYPRIEVPNQPGANTVTISVSGGPIPVVPLTKSVIIAEKGTDPLTYLVPDEEIDYAEAFYSYRYSDGSGGMYPVTAKLSRIDGGTLLGFDITELPNQVEAYLSISTNKQSFVIHISEDQFGVTTPVDISSFVPVTTTIPGTGTGFSIKTQAFTYLDADGQAVIPVSLNPGAKIQPGTYNVQINAEDNDRAYMLYRGNVEVGKQGASLVFQKSELAQITPKMSGSGLQIRNFAAFGQTSLYLLYYLQLNQLKPIVINKGSYSFQFGYQTPDQWSYSYNSDDVSVTKDLTFKMDTSLKAKITIRNRYYSAGSELSYPDSVGVFDSFNNRLEIIYIPTYGNNATHLFKNRSTGETFKTQARFYEPIYFPGNDGVYDYTYSVDGPVKVTPATAIVKVGEGPEVSKLTPSKTPVILEGVTSYQELSVTANYADGTKEDVTAQASWTTDDENVAYYYMGDIIAAGIGKTNITAEYKGKIVTIPVSVIAKSVSSLTVSPTKITARPGADRAIVLTAAYKDKTKEDVTTSAEWTTTNAKIAEMTDGKLVIHDYGTATLTAKYGGKQAAVTVDSSIKSFVIGTAKLSELKSVSLKPGDDLQLIAKAVFSDSAKAETLSDVQWSVSDSSILSVENGLVHVKTFGSATVTAAFGGKTAVLTVNATIKSLSASIGKSSLPKTVTMKLQETKQITLSAVLGDNSKSDATQAASWSTSNASIATVEAGLVTAKQFGKATVTAAYGGKTISFVIDTTIKSLTADKKTISSHPGGTTAVKLSAVMADNSKADASSLAEWSSADPQTASVVNGVVTIHKLGKTTITGSYGGKSVTVTVDATVTSLTASTTKLSGKPGDSKSVTLSAVYGDRTKAVVTAEAEWVSSNASVASVDDGTITFHTMDKATITATYGGKKVTLTADASVSKLTPSATSIRLKAGGTQQVTVKATYNDGKTMADVTGDVQFSVANTTVASVQLESGKLVVTALKKGSTKLTLKYGGKTVEINITVS